MPYVYLIKSLSTPNNWIYVGSTENLEKRIQQHNSGQVRSTQFRKPYKVIHIEKFQSISDARKREKEIKNKRSLKESLIKIALSSSPISHPQTCQKSND